MLITLISQSQSYISDLLLSFQRVRVDSDDQTCLSLLFSGLLMLLLVSSAAFPAGEFVPLQAHLSASELFPPSVLRGPVALRVRVRVQQQHS